VGRLYNGLGDDGAVAALVDAVLERRRDADTADAARKTVKAGKADETDKAGADTADAANTADKTSKDGRADGADETDEVNRADEPDNAGGGVSSNGQGAVGAGLEALMGGPAWVEKFVSSLVVSWREALDGVLSVKIE
jgi:hypothetical protein